MKDISVLVCLFQKAHVKGGRNAAEVHGKGKQNGSIVNELSTNAITVVPALQTAVYAPLKLLLCNLPPELFQSYQRYVGGRSPFTMKK